MKSSSRFYHNERLHEEDFDPIFVQLLKDHLDEGWSVGHFRGVYSITEAALTAWRKISPEFDALINAYNDKKNQVKNSMIAQAVSIARKTPQQ